nr:tetratricopeptide repeat protein [Sulfurimonas sp.]
IAKKIVQIYIYKKEYVKLLSFLKKSNSNNDLLLQLYRNSNNYEKAYKLAEKLYEENGEIDYFAQSAMFEYESAKDKNNKKMQRSVVEKLTKVVKLDNSPLYLNYLGYLLINHSIDIDKGMKYVREALEIEPNSAFYMDSLAWGYYKLGRCKKASEIMKNVLKLEGGDDSEVLKHIEEINRCKNKKTGVK